MNTIKIVLTFIIPFILLSGCSKDDSLAIPVLNDDSVYATRSYNNPTVPSTNVQFFSTKDISGILHGWLDPNDIIFKGIDREKYSVITVSEEGYNLIYVVNFDDGGWVLISAIMLDNGPILGLGTKDGVTTYFDPYDIKAPVASYLFEGYKNHILKKIKESRDSRLTNKR